MKNLSGAQSSPLKTQSSQITATVIYLENGAKRQNQVSTPTEGLNLKPETLN